MWTLWRVRGRGGDERSGCSFCLFIKRLLYRSRDGLFCCMLVLQNHYRSSNHTHLCTETSPAVQTHTTVMLVGFLTAAPCQPSHCPYIQASHATCNLPVSLSYPLLTPAHHHSSTLTGCRSSMPIDVHHRMLAPSRTLVVVGRQ